MPLTDRRAFMAYCSTLGLGATLFPAALWSRLAAGATISVDTVRCAEEIAGLTFAPDQREMMVEELNEQAKQLQALRSVRLPNEIPPALHFDPVLPGMRVEPGPGKRERSRVRVPAVSANLEELAFLPLTTLSELVMRKKVTSLQLTRMYLDRLRRYDPTLKCVVTFTQERALQQARAADEEIRRGKYRGPLHGIPWGAKDLLATKGYPTTWGTGPFREQVIDTDATVVQRLDAAGAVLIAKLTLGELAYGDVWFGGMTRNPWKTDQGSSGSSAGPASATAAGLVGFSIGSETLGSISSPSTRCGTTGLRPTFGRVPRTGAMALSWSMDKLGPICRSVEDCALVLEAIAGPDGHDLTVRDLPFAWDVTRPLRSIRIGYVKSAFDADHPTKKWDDAALDVVRRLGVPLMPVEIPDMPYSAIRPVLTVEAAAAFDELTRSGRDKEMTRQTKQAWPNLFRAARFIPAVEYVNANRLRTMAMQKWAELMRTVDVIVAPTFGPQLLATNLTGHPAVILPNGFRDDGTPVSLTFVGGLYQEATLCAVAHAYQQATTFHLSHPSLKV